MQHLSGRSLAYIGLGSNLHDPVNQLMRAFGELNRLPGTRLLRRSSLYRTAPVGKADQPDFVNAVAQLETELAAPALLQALLSLENAHQRVRGEINGPRTLDLDLLLFGNEVIRTPNLQVPHPRMHERAFVLRPLAELDPAAQIPGHGVVSDLVPSVVDQRVTRIDADD
ncbi:MAG: 2-amino-4-hydroxy-6-hydroxymethyldihydropteridine diphosphokinase [Proteobacteria bacterium]|nr:MAG: 2-amino-4-hydroxy-6-hydroxymethyldihydropteridine diphosphokinase [Pseudomonadota bacterium]